MISKVQIPVAVFDHVLSGVHKNLATCQGTRTQRVGGVRTGPWQRRHPTWMGGDSQLLKHSTLQCCGTTLYCSTAAEEQFRRRLALQDVSQWVSCELPLTECVKYV